MSREKRAKTAGVASGVGKEGGMRQKWGYMVTKKVASVARHAAHRTR